MVLIDAKAVQPASFVTVTLKVAVVVEIGQVIRDGKAFDLFLQFLLFLEGPIPFQALPDDVHEMMMSYVCIYRVLYHVLFGVTIEYKVDYLAVQKCHA